MQAYEYTVLPAPNRGEKTRGARTGIERFAHALTREINRMALEGWEYVRAETLPCEERSGLTSRTTVYHNLLVFRRALAPAPPQRTEGAALAASHEAGPALRPLAPVQPAPSAEAASPTEPSPDWPDGDGADEETLSEPARAEAARVDDYDEPAFDPDRSAGPAEAPPFVQRPPLSAQRPERREGGIFSEPMPGNGGRLGPAER